MEGTISLISGVASIREAIEKYADSYEPNATYKTKPEAKDYLALPIVKALSHAIGSGLSGKGQRYYLEGDAGIGKTSFVKAICDYLGVELVYIQAANSSVENCGVPFPREDEETATRVLEMLLYKKFVTDNPKVIFIDEIGRADVGFANTLMELLQEGTFAGRKIPNLLTVIAADNPQGVAYGRMAGLDFSHADRFAAVRIDAKGTPWRRALASEFASTDLSKVFSTYDTLDVEVRRVLNPRVLEFLIRGLLRGFPGVLALPIVTGQRQRLVNSAGSDVTDQTLDKIAAALGVPNREKVPDLVAKTIKYAVEERQNVYIQGPPGIGKTSVAKDILTGLGIDFAYDSAAVLSPEDMTVPFPSKDGSTLDLIPMSKFNRKTPWVWIVDEIARGSRRTQNAIMEPIQERTIGGNPTSLIATIALNNPREVAGMKLDVGKNDLAQASRFALSIEIEASDIASPSYLRKVYGEDVATPFIEWWEDDLDAIGRVLCTPRGLERMISIHEAGNPLEWGLPRVKGEYVKVPLVELHARLDKRPLARLKQVVANVDQYAEELARGKDETPMEHATVYMAFLKADVSQLEQVRDVCLRLFEPLDRQHKIDLIRQGGDRQKFWNAVLLEVEAAKEAAKEAEAKKAAKKSK